MFVIHDFELVYFKICDTQLTVAADPSTMERNDESNSKKGIFSNVQVTLRVKPCAQETISVISKVRDNPKMIKMCNKTFSFDYIKWEGESQEQVYKAAAYPFVEKALEGYSATILAFGQTGSGKSYTMGSLESTTRTWRTSGLIQRCLKHIFEQSDVQVLATFVEIYNEELHDLLDTGAPIITRRSAKIDRKIEKISSCQEGLSLVRKALGLRQERMISLNSSTSQSHAILTLHLTVDHGDRLLASKLNLVDLAGTRIVERIKFPNDEPLGIKCCINEGLSALNSVITAMSETKDLVPVLCNKNSFDGKSQISLVVCLSQDLSDYDENLETLQFAERVKLIEIHPTQSNATYRGNCFADQLKAATRQLSGLLSPAYNDSKILKQQQEERNVAKTSADCRIKNCTVVIEKSNIDLNKYRKIREHKENIPPVNGIDDTRNVKSPLELSTGNEVAVSLASTVSISQLETQNFHKTSVDIGSTNSEQCNCETNFEDHFSSSHSECEMTQEMKLEFPESEISVGSQCQCSNFDVHCFNGLYECEKSVKSNDTQCSPNYQASVGKKVVRNTRSKQQIENSEHQVETPPRLTSQNVSSSEQFYNEPGTSYARTNQMKRMNAVLKSDLFEFENGRPLDVRRFYGIGASQVNINYPNKYLKTDKNRLAVTPKPNKTLFKYEEQPLEYDDYENGENLSLLDLKNKKLAHSTNILRILNLGNPKQLATLPQIGSKTAIIIYHYRMLNGEFNSLKDLRNIPAWSKKFCDKFFAANNISLE